MKKECRKISAALVVLALICLFAASCGAPAPSGMFAPSDNKKYVEGVEDAIFSVPEDYTVTMSSNMLAAKKDDSVFSLQCRHSDYYYGSLKKNYEELKSQLSALYGDYNEEITIDRTVAGQDAIEVRYTLRISGENYDYVQYLFYEGKNHFYLFTYSVPSGKGDGALLDGVVKTISLNKDGYTPPAGFRAVQNAEVDAISFDQYEIYCPDDWILDTSMGQICMRVPSSRNISTVLFNEIDGGGDFEKYAQQYSEKFAPDLIYGNSDALQRYIMASVYRMTNEYKDFEIYLTSSEQKEALSKQQVSSLRDDYLQTYTSSENLKFTYIEYYAKLSDYGDHGSGGLFVDTSKIVREEDKNRPISSEPVYAEYHIRQHFLRSGDTVYMFTYISDVDHFTNMESDALKVVKNFVLKNGADT